MADLLPVSIALHQITAFFNHVLGHFEQLVIEHRYGEVLQLNDAEVV